MTERWKHDLLGANWILIKSQQDNSSFKTIIQGELYDNFHRFLGFVFCRKLARTKTPQDIDKFIEHNSHTLIFWNIMLLTWETTGVVTNSSFRLSFLHYTSSPFAPTSRFSSASVTNIVSRHWQSMPPLPDYSNISVWKGIWNNTTTSTPKHQTRMIRLWLQRYMYNIHEWVLISVDAPYFHHS